VAVVSTELWHALPSTRFPEQRVRNEGEAGGNKKKKKHKPLYLKKHYRIRELFQGANKILNYSSSVQLILDPLKEKKVHQNATGTTITT